MKKNSLYSFAIAALFLSACSSHKKMLQTNGTTANTTTTTVADGSSYEKAIVIKAKTDLAGTSEEYAWIRQNYPGAKTVRQALYHHNSKSYDVLNIVLADGSTKELYFDITNSFGHY